MTKKNYQFLDAADRALTDMTYKTLQKECIIRGIEFEKVSASDHGLLASFFVKNFTEPKDDLLLNAYDTYIEKRLKSNGADSAFFHPQLRYAFLSEEKEITPTIKPETVKGPKVKKERTEQGIYKGTKKALTYQLAEEGKTKAEAMELILETFPEASPKSIGIWFNKALKMMKVD